MDEKIVRLLNLNERVDSFLESDTYRFYRFLNQNRLTISVLRGNYYDLLNIYEQHNSKGLHDRMWDNTNAKYRHKFQKEIIRCLSNYLGSVKATIDYSTKSLVPFIKRNQELYSKYQVDKINFIAKVQSHKFIQDLRNYTLHDSVIMISSEYSRNTSWTEDKKDIFIKKNEVLQWKLSSESTNFIQKQGDKIYIMQIVKNHFEAFLEFQNLTYLYLFLVDPAKTDEYLADISSFYDDMVALNNRNLMYTKGYVKYLEKVIKIAHRY